MHSYTIVYALQSYIFTKDISDRIAIRMYMYPINNYISVQKLDYVALAIAIARHIV